MTANPPGRADADGGEQADRGWRLRHLPVLLVACAIVTVPAGLVAGLLGGAVGAFGAVVGVTVVAAAYLLSTLVIAWADSVAPALVMPFGMAAYLVKITVIGGVMMVLAAAGWAGLVPMAWGVVAGVLAWTATSIWWLTRHRPGDQAHRPGDQAHRPGDQEISRADVRFVP